MASKTIDLPTSEEIMRKLAAIPGMSDHEVEQLHPLIARKGGQRKTGNGIALMLTLAFNDYAKQAGLSVGLLLMTAPDYIDALIDDEEVKADAKNMLARAGA